MQEERAAFHRLLRERSRMRYTSEESGASEDGALKAVESMTVEVAGVSSWTAVVGDFAVCHSLSATFHSLEINK